MKEQKLIVTDSISKFRGEVNDALQHGWIMIPDSLRVATSIAMAQGDWGLRQQTNNSFAVIMEKVA